VWYIPHTVQELRLVETQPVSQIEADLEAASVQQFVEKYLSLCRQRIRYQTGGHNLQHTYIIDIHVCKNLCRSMAQAVSRTAEDLSRTHGSRICGGQSGNGTDFL
jgi:hypothetical protein